MALDTIKTNIGYRLGRLYAVIEDRGATASKRAQDHDNAVLQPSEAFPRLLKQASQNGANQGLIAEIMDAIIEFPETPLSIPEQGEFELGYYHQRAML